MNYITVVVFLFFSGECLAYDCGEVHVPRECFDFRIFFFNIWNVNETWLFQGTVHVS